MVLYLGRDRAKAYKQALHWDTAQELSKHAARHVYTVLEGEEYAIDLVSKMARFEKEAEAKARLYKD